MKEDRIDVSGKKNIKIIRPRREVESYIEDHAILDIVRETKMPCSNMDPFGLDTVLDCLTCSNNDYQIVIKGKIIKAFQEEKSKQNQEKKTRYIIEFFERIPKPKNLVEYLAQENSNYRITRDNDGIILRPSLEDRKKKEEEQARKRAEFEEMERRLFGSYIEETSKMEETKSSPVKKKSIFQRILGTTKKQNVS